MQSVYSWMGSRLHLILEDEVAEAYNRFQDSFFAAQEKYKDVNGKEWNPVNEPLWIEFDEKDKEVWDKIGNLINLMIELNGGGLTIPEEEMTSDYLVKL